MKKGSIFVIVALLVGAALILADLLTNWSLLWKLAPAGGVLLIGLLLLMSSGTKKGSPTPTTPTKKSTTKKPTPAKIGFLEMLIMFIIALAIGGAVVYGIWFYVLTPIWESPHGEVAKSIPEVRVVNNGFHRHDAPTPPLINPHPFSRELKAKQVYSAFKVKKGQTFRLIFDRPVDMRVMSSASDPFIRRDTPGKYRASQDGLIQVRSETGRNHVQISPAN